MLCLRLDRSPSPAAFGLRLRSGKAAHLYILFEHKSHLDPGIFSQLLSYLARIYRQQSQQGQLIPVLPFVFYHGGQEWKLGTNFMDRFDLDEREAAILSPYIPAFSIELFDLDQADLEQGRRTGKIEAAGRMLARGLDVALVLEVTGLERQDLEDAGLIPRL
ncbi:MAG: Rpn family recombination-promoting nuclease/putative transposase [Spirochaetales bacterium]|nr:Rpn family recombination-promoting nuclease/putative transposase [Spirochaetales bacterium]